MNPHIYFFLGLLFKIVASDDYDPSRLNFGTVIFKYQDLRKHNWTERQIGLLYARMYFQNIVESLNNLDIHDKNYLDDHFRFFQDAYQTLERQARDPKIKVILKTALSDTIGGYLKAKVLPTTKYAYYAGSIPYQSVACLYDFYRDIKRQLKTTGEGWHQPQRGILRTIHISDITTVVHHNTFLSDLQAPCQQLAYYEKKPKIGLTAPIPKIRWARNATTLFLPFENQTLFSIMSPNCTKELFKYLIVAIACLKSTKTPDEPAVKDFESRFQLWLNNDVVPHLHEEQLYPGLGGILALVTCVNNINDYFPNKDMPNNNNSFMAINCQDRMSKKLLILLILLIVEIMWCVPALACAWTWKQRSNSNSESSSGQQNSANFCGCFNKSKQSSDPVDVLFRNRDSKNNQTSTGSSPTSCSSIYNVIDSTSNSHTLENNKRLNSKGTKNTTPSLKEASCNITVDCIEKGTMKAYPSQSAKRSDKNTMKGLSAQSAAIYLEKETMKGLDSDCLCLKNQEVQGTSFTAGGSQSRPETDNKYCIATRDNLETTVPYTRAPTRKQRSISIHNYQDSTTTLSRHSSKVPATPKISITTATVESSAISEDIGPSSSIARKSSSSCRRSSTATLADSACCCRTEIAIPEEVTYECIDEIKKIKKYKKTASFSNENVDLPQIDVKDSPYKSNDDVRVDVIGMCTLLDEKTKDTNQDTDNKNMTKNFHMEMVKDPCQQDDNRAGPSKTPKPKMTVNLDIEIITRKGKPSKIPKLSITPIQICNKDKCGTKHEVKLNTKDLCGNDSRIPILRLRRISDDSKIEIKKKNDKESKLNVTM